MASRMINYKPDSIIYFKGDKASSVFLLKEGKVVLEYDDIETGEKVKDTINPGEFFGVKSGLIKYPREELARVITNSIVVEFPTQDFEQLIAKNTSIILKMLRSFSNQLRKIGKQVQKIVSTKTSSDPATDLFLIGDYYLKSKKYSQAITVFERYMQYYPNGSLINEAKERLTKAKEYKTSYGDGGGPTPVLSEINKFF